MIRCNQCEAEAVVFLPGTEPIHELFLLSTGTPLRCFCLTHACAAGWPWLVSRRHGGTASRRNEGTAS